MIHKAGYIQSQDKLQLFYQHWLPESTMIAQIFLIHGFSEHSGRYSQWARKFVDHNIGVFAIDLRGHGKSDGQRGHTPSFRHMLNDIERFITRFRSDQEIPGILYGQSLGGNLVLNYILNNNTRLLNGIISTSPWLSLVTEPKTIIALGARIIRKIAPKFSRNAGLAINLLSHDPAVAEAYATDQLNHSRITPNLFFGTKHAAKKIFKHYAHFSLPILLMHGSGDKVTSFNASEKLARKAQENGAELTFIPWENLFHELHNEYDNDRIFQSILDWMQTKLDVNL